MQYPLFNDIGVIDKKNRSKVHIKKDAENIKGTNKDTEKEAINSIEIFTQEGLFSEEYVQIERTIETGGGEEEKASKHSRNQLLKWVGNKQRFAQEIVSYFPTDYDTYFEPFLGSGAVWSLLSPKRALVSDVFAPLIEIWQTLQSNPEMLKCWYAERWNSIQEGNKVEVYEKVKASYNAHPNGADLLFLCRTCYGGVVRFRKSDGYMSTPC